MQYAARMNRFAERYGRFALIAGGSAGLGAEFARQLAGRGLDLVLLAEAAHPLEELAVELRERHRVEVRTLVVDLARADLLEQIAPVCAGAEVGLVACVAAAAPLGRFVELPLEEKLRVLEVNCRAPLLLLHCFGEQMARRRRGGLLVMSSIAGLQGSPMVATYAASKAFGRILAESLWEELGPEGVDVLAICAGPTRTPTFAASRPRQSFFPPVMEASAVVEEALRSLGRKPSVVTGLWNRVTALLVSRLLPPGAAARVMGRGMLSSYPHLVRR
jgi:uncharacterized protein